MERGSSSQLAQLAQSAQFIPFYFIEDQSIRQDLTASFLKDPNNDHLSNIYKKETKGVIKFGFHQCEIPGMYIVMVKGTHDGILVKMGLEHNFPRGFPVLWIPTVLTRYFGFLPKFSNDERCQEVDNFKGAQIESIRFFKKWSGFLGQLLVWKHNERTYWTVCSKNSASFESNFVKDAHRLFVPYVTPELVQKMVSGQYHICAEIMSKYDQVHGAKVLKESPVVTVIGRKSQNSKEFVSFMTHSEVVRFCSQFGLPCDSAITIQGTIQCMSFLDKLSQERDYLTDSSLNTLVQTQSNSLKIEQGTISHSEILGERLEGLVLNITCKNQQLMTKKYKFPGYTIRTMLFRPEFEQNKFVFGMSLKTKAKRFVDHWCISENGRKFWYNKALEGFMIMERDPTQFSINNSKTFKDGRVTSEKVALAALLSSPNEELSDAVGVHIQLCDYLDTTPFRECESDFNSLSKERTTSTVVIVCGPIGSGKSSIAQKLCDTSSILLEHIDGDVLGIGMTRTMNLKLERNDYSMWKILKVLMAGKVPVISTGGGILFSFKSEFVLRNIIQKVLGISVNIIVIAADDSVENITPFTRDFPNFTRVYNNLQNVQDVVKRRVTNGEWIMPNDTKNTKDAKDVKNTKNTKNTKKSKTDPLTVFASMIAEKSKKNQKFAESLVSVADYTFLFPIIKSGTESSYNSQIESLNFSNILNLISTKQKDLSGHFTQIRILTEIIFPGSSDNQIRHITWKYDDRSPIEMSLKDISCVTQCDLNKQIDATLFELDGGKGKTVKLIIPCKQGIVHDDGRTHVTVDSGEHEAKFMADVALSIFRNEHTVSLPGPARDPSNRVYNIKGAKTSKCKLMYLDVFGIK
jgi:shikimate kinase